MKPSQVYNKHFLSEDLYRASISLKSHQFADFHLTSLNRLGKGFCAESMTATVFEDDGDFCSSVSKNSPRIAESYEAVAHLDDYTPVALMNSGVALYSEAHKTIDEWQDTALWKRHLSIFDCHRMVQVCYDFPFKKNTHISFVYLNPMERRFSINLSEEAVEYMSYPFFLGWLHVHNVICDQTLRAWLELLEGMTLPRFRLLRAIAGEGISNSSAISVGMGVTKGTVYRHIENSFENLLRIQHGLFFESGNANRILALAHSYHFLRFGAGKVIRKLPRHSHNV